VFAIHILPLTAPTVPALLWAPQGGPIPGNEEFKLAFEATVGRAYKYVYRMDLVSIN